MRLNRILSIALCILMTFSYSVITCLADAEPQAVLTLSASSVSNDSCTLMITPSGSNWKEDVDSFFLLDLPDDWTININADGLKPDGEHAAYFIQEDGNTEYTHGYFYQVLNSDDTYSSQYVILFHHDYFPDGVTLEINGIQGEGKISISPIEGDNPIFREDMDFLWGETEKYEPLTISPSSSGSGDDPVAESYIASFGDPSPQQVAPGETFTVPVKLTSTSNLAAAQLTLVSENADIVSVTDSANELTLTSGNKTGFWESSKKEDGSYLVSFYGNTADAAQGLVVATVKLEAVSVGTSTLSIKEGVTAQSGQISEGNGIAISNLNELTPAEVSVVDLDIKVSEFTTGVWLVEYTPAGALPEDQTPTYNGKAMYMRSDESNIVYQYLVMSTDELTVNEAKTVFSWGAGTAVNLATQTRGDLNNSNSVNIVDAQIAYDVACGIYTEKGFSANLTTDSLDMLHWLMADSTLDKKVEPSDARAIQVFIHTGSFAPTA